MFDPKRPVVCFDESPTQLIGDFRNWLLRLVDAVDMRVLDGRVTARDAMRSDEIIGRNNSTKNPGFMPATVEVLAT